MKLDGPSDWRISCFTGATQAAETAAAWKTMDDVTWRRKELHLVGGWPTPLKNLSESQLRWWNSQYMESHKIHVPNHQPDIQHVHPPCFLGSVSCEEKTLDSHSAIIISKVKTKSSRLTKRLSWRGWKWAESWWLGHPSQVFLETCGVNYINMVKLYIK